MLEATKLINDALEIVKLGTQKFKVSGGYIMPRGYAFKHPKLGYLAFCHSPNCPYNPIGGQNALKEILDAGGFTGFEDIVWLQDMI
ncbi:MULTISPECIES: 3-isopropylmalate dehydratase [unclassified Paenibacillus]|uniref:3-isopropylmalate dehydratase n=1 Tax=unclassified Paenibacillus TaxID=185978 RepID=UPI0030F59CFB